MSQPSQQLQRFGRLLPSDLIKPEEQLLYASRPSPWYILLGGLGSLFTIALITVIIALLVMLTPITAGAAWVVWVVGGFLFVVRLLWQALMWWTHIYILTSGRVLRRVGVLSVSVFEASRTRLQQTQMDASLLERVCRIGTIAFATAGSDGYDAFWVMVRKPHRVHQLVSSTLPGDGLN